MSLLHSLRPLLDRKDPGLLEMPRIRPIPHVTQGRVNTMKSNIRNLCTVTMLAGVTSLAGCGEISQGVKLAKAFGQTADSFQEKTDRLASDIYLSCIRNARYISLASVPQREPDKARILALQVCEEEYKPTSQRAATANQVVTDYIRAVGHLAGDKNVQFKSEFETIKKSLVGLLNTGIPFQVRSEAVEQGVRIANAVFEWMANRYRNVELSKAVICSNEPLKVYLDGLSYAYNTGYINGILADEERSVRRYYGALAADQVGSLRNTNNAIKVRDYEALNANSYDALMAIRNNRAAAQGYIRILGLTSKANAEIASVLTKSGYQVSPQQCTAYLTPSPSTGATSLMPRQAPKPQEIGLKQQAMIADILAKYNSLIKRELDAIRL